MTTVTRHALRVYAALSGLKANNQNGDVLDALIPFLEPVLAAMHGTIFDGGLLSLGVQKIYGWRFNKDVAESFTGRLLAKGYLERQAGAVFTVSFQPPANADGDQVEIGQVLEHIIDDFEQFPPKITDLFQFSLDRERLKDILIRFLVSFDAFTEEAFALHVERIRLGMANQAVLDRLEEGGRPLSREEQYLCARFVNDLVKNKSEFVPHLARLASIGLLTEVVDDFVKPTRETKKSDLTLILDTPVALDLLGLSGKEACEDIANVVTSLRGIGCNVIVLPVSVEEMSRNLESMLSQPLGNRHGPTHSALMKNEINEDFVRSVVRDPERALQQFGVTVRPIDLTTTPSQTKFFDRATYDDFFAGIRWKADSVDAREHDATCAALTMRLRAGHKSADPLTSKFVFVTTNPIFVDYARDFCRKNRMINDRQTPPVIIKRELAMTAWLRTGLVREDAKAKQIDIPRGHLIASCERVLRPRKEVLKAVHDKLKEFDPERAQQFELLLSDQRSVERLMDETLGLERLATTANPEMLLEEMRNATASEVRSEFEKKARVAAQRHGQEKRELKEAHEADVAEAKRALDQRDAEIETLRLERERLRAMAVAAKQGEVDRVDNLISGSNRFVGRLEKGMTWSTVAVLAAGATGSMIGLPQTAAVLTAGVLGVTGLYHTVRELQQKPKIGFQNLLDGVARFRLRRGLKALGLDYSKFEDTVEVRYGRIFWLEEKRAKLLLTDSNGLVGATTPRDLEKA
ncbi:MAG: hypothetical protein K0S00_4818 [Xanthobacteraceae bacterium]|nr:hypothetical protein [Xanthobacteraceae bacterium]